MSLWREVLYGLRKLRKNPGYALAAILSLAIGIGGTATIFSLVDALLLQKLPGVQEQERLVNLHYAAPDDSLAGFSTPNFEDLQRLDGTLSGIAGYSDRALSMGIGDEARLVLSQIVTDNYFDVLQVRAAEGRTFTAGDGATRGANPVVIISHALWQRSFGGDPRTVGRTVHVNGHPFTIIGVAEERFGGTFIGFVFDLWVPASMAEAADPAIDPDDRGDSWMELVGRLAPGVSIEQARAELATAGRRLEESYPTVNESFRIEVEPLTGYDEGLRSGVAGFLGIIFSVALMVLVMACFNVANMLLAQAADRRKEVAIRLAMGVSRPRLVRQLLTESVVLALLSGFAGLLLAHWGIRAIRVFEPPVSLPLVFHVELDLRVLLFALALAVLAGLGFGIVPALQASRPQLVPSLKGNLDEKGRSWLRRTLVVGQVAVSLLLLICTGLFLRTLQHAANTDLGFEPEGVQTVTLDPRVLGSETEDSRRFFRELTDRLRSLPGVEEVGVASRVPLGVGGLLGSHPLSVQVPGVEPPEDQAFFRIEHSRVGPGYFEALEIPLLSGRGFRESDREDSRPVAVVNTEMAERFWPDGDAIGREFLREDGSGVTIVGVARTGKYRFPGEDPTPFIYLSYAQAPTVRTTVLLRTRGEPEALAPAIRREVWAMAPDLPIQELQPLREAISISVLPQRMAASVAGVLGLIGLVLAGLGIYGIVAYAVSRRARELGVRLCLGAERSDLMASVIWDGLKLAGAGIALGLGLAFFVTRFLESFLFGVEANDPLTFGGISLLLVLIALLACYVPARSVVRIEPVVAAKAE